jgi:hypothetical protein
LSLQRFAVVFFVLFAILTTLVPSAASAADCQREQDFCYRQLIAAVDRCGGISGWLERQLCFLEAGLRWENCLASIFSCQ